MDSGFPLNIIGWGITAPQNLRLHEIPPNLETDCDSAAWLRNRKSIKLMAKADHLALTAAGQAVKDAGLTSAQLERAGIYFAVGRLAFEDTYLNQLYQYSQKDGAFDMARFSNETYWRLHPLLTFKCLPNMAVFHVSFNLGIHGPSFVSYPGIGQWFSALNQAHADLNSGRVQYALLGAVADRRNVLVRDAIRRESPKDEAVLIDSACVWALALKDKQPKRGTITQAKMNYLPFQEAPKGRYLKVAAGVTEPSLAASLTLTEGHGKFEAAYQTEDGISGFIRVVPS